MDFTYSYRRPALFLAALMMAQLLTGCMGGGGRGSQASLPPIDDTRRGEYTNTRAGRAEPRQGMSTGKKVAILAGAAALYYLYKRNQNRQGTGPEGQYYLSKNGRVYYRDENGRAHWVTPPRRMEVPMDELQRYPEISRYRGYNNSQAGEDFGNLY